MPTPKLTVKQEKFCHAYIETGNASEAYRRAYDCQNMKENSIHRMAHEVLRNLKVASRLREIAAAHAERHEITIDSLTKMLCNAYHLAMKEEVAAPSAAVAAAMGLGKLHQLIVDKKHVTGEHDHKHNHEHRGLSDTAEWASRLIRRGRADSALQEPLLN